MSGLSLAVDRRFGEFRLQLQATLPLSGCSAVLGPSGSGKTTLLRCLAGLEPTGPGLVIEADGDTWQDAATSRPPERRDLACVFQDLRLFPHLTVAGNLDYPLRRRRGAGLDGAPDLAQVVEMLALAPLLPRRPHTLSRGQQQRVAIGRALLCRTRLLLLDEPLASLDQEARHEILEHLGRLRGAGIAMVLVSHAMDEVIRLADHALLLRDGALLGAGDLPTLATDLGIASRLDEPAAIIDARVEAHGDDGLTTLRAGDLTLLTLGAPGATTGELRVRIPARDVALALTPPADTSLLNMLRARIDALQALGDGRVLVRLDAGGVRLLAMVTERSARSLALEPGRPVHALVKSIALATANVP